MLRSILTAAIILASIRPTPSFAQTQSVDDVIESYITEGLYNSSTSPCSGSALRQGGMSLSQYMRRKTNGIVAQLNRGDSYTLVGGKVLQALGAVSYCYKEQGRPVSDKGNISADMATLLLHRLEAKRDYGTNPVDLNNARTLVAFAKLSGNKMQAEEARLESFKASEAAPISRDGVSGLNFNDVAKEFKSNSLRVRRKFENKPVSGSGIVYNVRLIEATPIFGGGGEDRLIVYFDGPKTYLNGNSGDLADATFVRCYVPLGTPSEDKAIDIDKGDIINVEGVFTIDGGMTPTIEIKDCIIL